jgi:hypothetical protein
MRKTLSILLSILSLTVMAQVPQGVDYQAVATDANGIEQWTKTYGDTSQEVGYSVQQTSDGGYIITGFGGDMAI